MPGQAPQQPIDIQGPGDLEPDDPGIKESSELLSLDPEFLAFINVQVAGLHGSL